MVPKPSKQEPTVGEDKRFQVCLAQDRNQKVEVHIFHHSHGSAVTESLQKSVQGLQESISGSHIINLYQTRRDGRGGSGDNREAYSNSKWMTLHLQTLFTIIMEFVISHMSIIYNINNIIIEAMYVKNY